MNKLTIEYVKNIVVGNRVYLWVKLSTENETRECCYTRHNRVWCYEIGDCEPEMSNELRILFDGKKGNAALYKVYNSYPHTPVTLEA